jgi:hypothetical protein
VDRFEILYGGIILPFRSLVSFDTKGIPRGPFLRAAENGYPAKKNKSTGMGDYLRWKAARKRAPIWRKDQPKMIIGMCILFCVLLIGVGVLTKVLAAGRL